jgi:hypothetical protein
MKHLPLVVAAVVVLLTGLTIALGARVREDTVVQHPYEEGLAAQHAAAMPAGHDHAHATAAASACDLGAGPCTSVLDGAELRLELGPRPLAAMRELAVAATVLDGGAPVDGAELELSFAMPGMDMGQSAVRLAPAGGGRYAGKAVLVRCHSGRRDWQATVALRRGGRAAQATLAITLGE